MDYAHFKVIRDRAMNNASYNRFLFFAFNDKQLEEGLKKRKRTRPQQLQAISKLRCRPRRFHGQIHQKVRVKEKILPHESEGGFFLH